MARKCWLFCERQVKIASCVEAVVTDDTKVLCVWSCRSMKLVFGILKTKKFNFSCNHKTEICICIVTATCFKKCL